MAHGRILATGLWLMLAAFPAQTAVPQTSLEDNTQGISVTTKDGPAEDRTLDLVIRALTDYFGLPEEALTPETDLETDLHADPLDIWEAVSMLCADRRRPPPERHVPTRVADIAAYLAGAPQLPATPSGAGGRDEHAVHVQTVHYATTRGVEDPGDPKHHYGKERAEPERGPQYGTCEVTIPVAAHERGRLESPSLLRLEFGPDPRKHIILRSVAPQSREHFLAGLRDRTAAAAGADDWSADTMVFVHGYNMSFAKAARRTAQMAYDFEFPGAAILFSWPSDGSLLRYIADREDAEWSAPHLASLLEDLLAAGGTRRLHLVAHSMGSQVLIRALDELVRRIGDEAPLFANVVLAAPDFDARVFAEHVAPRITGLAERWTLYASDKDVALDASRILSAQRLGSPLTLVEGVDSVDATGLDVSPWSLPERHAYYASKLRVVEDLVGVLRGLDPRRRGLSAAHRDGVRYWLFGPEGR